MFVAALSMPFDLWYQAIPAGESCRLEGRKMYDVKWYECVMDFLQLAFLQSLSQ
jgi:hypothetical protein